MSVKGWIIGLQPRLEGVAPYNIHLTVSPIHSRVAGEFIEDSRRSLTEPPPTILEEAYKLLEHDPLKLAGMIGERPIDSVIIALILGSISPEIAEDMAKQLTVEVFK